MVHRKSIPENAPPDLIERDLAATRTDMSGTIDEIRERFSAAHLKAEVRENISEKITRARARGEELANRVKDAAIRFGRSARTNSRQAGNSVLRSLRDDPAAARVVAFELGAMVVIIAQGVLKRSATRPQNPAEQVIRDKNLTLEEVQEKVKKAALAPEGSFRKAA